MCLSVSIRMITPESLTCKYYREWVFFNVQQTSFLRYLWVTSLRSPPPYAFFLQYIHRVSRCPANYLLVTFATPLSCISGFFLNIGDQVLIIGKYSVFNGDRILSYLVMNYPVLIPTTLANAKSSFQLLKAFFGQKQTINFLKSVNLYFPRKWAKEFQKAKEIRREWTAFVIYFSLELSFFIYTPN